ncbi:IDI1-like protein [Mya arenaria]|uniref:isopentenyl-diphosphate Delta-isomerase n=1 Tax=Mya arenaria TaxID=6604 RepID=A0ABY7DVJ9_MYAAR|nr:IDI1-like protein [Mya arenaria]
MKSHDELQQTYLKEVCILVNENDKVLGSASKKDCHLLSNINGGMLHRAFSVFLFNSKNELLLQQRSNAKITFPGMFTNTCCSHPLSTKLEMDEEKAMGVKRAAQRKLFHELGITPDQIPLNIFEYITRIQYSALNQPNDGIFGENEIDYVLIVKRDVDVSLNYNEVQSYRYVDQEGMKDLLAKAESGHILLTPWFTMICKEFLFKWWANLKKTTDFVDHKNIHKLSQ